MKILAIETSTMLGGVAVADDSKGLIAEIRLNVKSTHSERLMTQTDHLLRHSGLSIDDMDAFAVAVGPGSFTGLRIGISTVKGFAFATGKPVVSVSTLEALAMNFPFAPFPVCTLLDARKKEAYSAVFNWKENAFIRIHGEQAGPIARLLEYLSAAERKILFTGEGAHLFRTEISAAMRDNAIFPRLEKMSPSPANVASLALQKALQGEYCDPLRLAPFYARRSEAEIKRDV